MKKYIFKWFSSSVWEAVRQWTKEMTVSPSNGRGVMASHLFLRCPGVVSSLFIRLRGIIEEDCWGQRWEEITPRTNQINTGSWLTLTTQHTTGRNNNKKTIFKREKRYNVQKVHNLRKFLENFVNSSGWRMKIIGKSPPLQKSQLSHFFSVCPFTKSEIWKMLGLGRLKCHNKYKVDNNYLHIRVNGEETWYCNKLTRGQ